jgi:hypothetical protein
MARLAGQMRVIDTDTHLTERHDRFASRAPKGDANRVPRAVDADGELLR